MDIDTTKQPFLFRPPKYLLDAIKREASKNGETVSSTLSRLMRQEYERIQRQEKSEYESKN